MAPTQSKPFSQYLDLNGDGSGSIEQNVLGTLGAPVPFYTSSVLAVPGAKTMIVKNVGIVIGVANLNNVRFDDYGNINGILPNGCLMDHRDNGGGVITSVSGNGAIRDNGDWAILSANFQLDISLRMIWIDFDLQSLVFGGIKVNFDEGEDFAFIVRDNLTTLSRQRVLITGEAY